MFAYASINSTVSYVAVFTKKCIYVTGQSKRGVSDALLSYT